MSDDKEIETSFSLACPRLSPKRIVEFCTCDDKQPYAWETPTRGTGPVNSIDISFDGQFMASAADNDKIAMYKLETGDLVVNYPVMKYGAENLTFVPTQQSHVICSSLYVNDDLRLLSLDDCHKPAYIRYFQGHTSRVSSLDIASDGNVVISGAAVEKTIRLWDKRMQNQAGMLECESIKTEDPIKQLKNELRMASAPRPCVAFDRDHAVVAVAWRGGLLGYLKIYDLRDFNKGPFLTENIDIMNDVMKGVDLDDKFALNLLATAKIESAITADFCDLKFSPDGKLLLLNTTGPYFYIYNAFSGKLFRRFERDCFMHPDFKSAQVSFSADSMHIIGGKGSFKDTSFCVWSVFTGRIIANVQTESLSSRKDQNIRCPCFTAKHIVASPTHILIAVAGGHRTIFLTPDF